MARKTFTAGQAVEVRRDTSSKTWEPATYLKGFADWRGWHRVELATDRHINSMSGMDCPPDDPQAIRTRVCVVPSQRLRDKTT